MKREVLSDIIANMNENRIPVAIPSKRDIKLGSIHIKSEEPKQSLADAKEGLKKLEKAAQQKVFVEHDTTE